MFIMMLSNKIAQMICSVEKDKKYLQMNYLEPLVQNENSFTEMALMLPSA